MTHLFGNECKVASGSQAPAREGMSGLVRPAWPDSCPALYRCPLRIPGCWHEPLVDHLFARLSGGGEKWSHFFSAALMAIVVDVDLQRLFALDQIHQRSTRLYGWGHQHHRAWFAGFGQLECAPSGDGSSDSDLPLGKVNVLHGQATQFAWSQATVYGQCHGR